MGQSIILNSGGYEQYSIYNTQKKEAGASSEEESDENKAEAASAVDDEMRPRNRDKGLYSYLCNYNVKHSDLQKHCEERSIKKN